MNKLLPSARFSPRNAREQRIRDAIRNGHGAHGDVRNVKNVWSRAAQAFHKNDPSGRKVAQLCKVKS